MIIDEIIALVKIERECIIRADVCDRKCEKCDLVQDSGKLIDMYEQLVELLEELKEYKENQHRSLRYMYEKGYNKALDDFVEKVKLKYLGVHPDELYEKYYPYEICKQIKEIAEQLKVGEHNDN